MRSRRRRSASDRRTLSGRMLHGRAGVAVTLFVFDVLAVEGLPVMSTPYSERRASLGPLSRRTNQGAGVGFFKKTASIDYLAELRTKRRGELCDELWKADADHAGYRKVA